MILSPCFRIGSIVRRLEYRVFFLISCAAAALSFGRVSNAVFYYSLPSLIERVEEAAVVI